ncbi:hypothetical protein PILCRDRAFT_80164 [Piloderma croceum F 1598]|uniref:Uncharacterized protein n=1 Tax=Piloderma croceum (strain F 1598) TaxID=765440 RepID=A0A0C3BAH2_PILCF|nr:hypothetical protein PILCRDRAFT_80164 [Piloderma croceum F 1598]
MLLPITLLSFSWFASVQAGSQTHGENCSVSANRLQVGTYQLYTECDTVTFCNSSGLCDLKRCRRDDYPFGYQQDSDSIPPKCPRGQFCPDEEDACQPLMPVGSACQLNRDDQCQAPENFAQLADNTPHGLNFNGSVCLNGLCMFANVTLGLTCVVENTAYIGYSGSDEFIDIVSRGNCMNGMYCDSQQKVCIQSKALGVSCDADKECLSYNCLSSGTCGKAAEAPNHFGTWVYAIVAIGIFGGMFGTLTGLFIVHRRQRDSEREKRMQYWREQNAFRQNIMNMRQSARDSILSLPKNGTFSNRSSAMYSHEGPGSEDSQAPMMPHSTTKSSGLRQQYYDDNSTEYDDGIMVPERRPDGRF